MAHGPLNCLTVTDDGTFEQGASTLQLRRDPDDVDRWGEVRRRLAEARDQRVPPARDDKVVAVWNALAVTALAEIGVVTQQTRLDCCGRPLCRAVVEHVIGQAVACFGCHATVFLARQPECLRTTRRSSRRG